MLMENCGKGTTNSSAGLAIWSTPDSLMKKVWQGR
jgi:hypothetical protein